MGKSVKMESKIVTIPIFDDFKCPHCGQITSKYCTNLQCGCHKKEGEIVNLGGIIHGNNHRRRPNMLIQIHRQYPDHTEMCAQRDFPLDRIGDHVAWRQEFIGDNPRPDGAPWVWMICTEESEFFVWQKQEAHVGNF